MTDRYAGFIVTLAQDMRADDAERTLSAIEQIKGVLAVEPVVSTAEVHIAAMRVRNETAGKLWDVLNDTTTPGRGR